MKKKALAESGFKKTLATELAKLTTERNKELGKLKAEHAKVSKELAQHEKSHDAFIQKETTKIDKKYEKIFADLDAKLMNESMRLQKENADFEKKKKAEEAAARKQHQAFMNDKNRTKAGIDQQIAQAQKERDAKIEARKKEREKQNGQQDRKPFIHFHCFITTP